MHPEFVIFDCDGVLIDSNDLKQAAFMDSLRDYDERYVTKFLEFNRVNGGMHRAQKFHYFYWHIIPHKTAQVEMEIKKRTTAFSRYCRQHLPTLPLTDGLREYVSHLNREGIPCFIVSGGNKEEIDLLLTHHNISRYFKKVYGGTQSKQAAIKQILETYNLDSSTGLFYGDSALDGKAANDNGVPFVFVSAYSEVSLSEINNITIHRTIVNFTDLHH